MELRERERDRERKGKEDREMKTDKGGYIKEFSVRNFLQAISS